MHAGFRVGPTTVLASDGQCSYAWMFIGSSAIGLGAVAIALTFRPPRAVVAPLLAPQASTP